MSGSKYQPGQTVTMIPRRFERTPPGSFRIVRLLPAENGTTQYRVQSTVDGHERVVSEAELA
jgi:hypothetical protein